MIAVAECGHRWCADPRANASVTLDGEQVGTPAWFRALARWHRAHMHYGRALDADATAEWLVAVASWRWSHEFDPLGYDADRTWSLSRYYAASMWRIRSAGFSVSRELVPVPRSACDRAVALRGPR